MEESDACLMIRDQGPERAIRIPVSWRLETNDY
jgi:hypothetical protein